MILNLQEILKGCVDGKEEYQLKLYEFFADRMFALCLQYSKDYAEAQDLLQEGFIKVFRKIDQFKSTGSFEGWVRRIFVNTAIEHFRSKKMKFSETEIQNLSEDFSFDDVLEQISAKDILDIVQELSPQYRLVFNMYAIEGYSHKEIAGKLDISEGTSKSNLSRARGILQKRVTELLDLPDQRKKELINVGK